MASNTALAQTALPPAQALPTALGEQSGAPSVVGGIIRDGRITELYAWGGADCAGNGAIDVAGAFEIGSISKHVTAVALLRLWEQDRIDLDRPVGDYLDDIPQAWRGVTLRQLATHTSGVPDYEEAGGYGIYETQPSAAEVYAIVEGRPLDFEPGTKWSYSNTGYFLLSKVIERVSGARFGDHLRAEFFAPLGMEQTFVGGYAPEGVSLLQGCKPAEDANPPRLPVKPIHEASGYGSATVFSTLADWALWDKALHDGELLSPKAMEVLLAPQRLADGENTEYSFGLIIDRFRGERRIHHKGQTQGFVADYQHFPDRKVGIVLFANMYEANPINTSRMLMLKAMPDLSYHSIPVPVDPDPARTIATRRALQQLVLGAQPVDLLSEDMAQFASNERLANARASLRPFAENADQLVYLFSGPNDDSRHTYKIELDGTASYLIFFWKDGKLVGIQRADQ